MPRFSKYYGITPGPLDDWFDPDMAADTALAVDPFEIYVDKDPRWAGSHGEILDFFATGIALLRDANGNPNSLAYRKVKNQLLFKEPAEMCLGLSKDSVMGSGSGRGLGDGMLAGLSAAMDVGLDEIDHIEVLALLTGGIGFDRLSDAVCNILKRRFIEYTQAVCRRHSIPMEQFRVFNAAWDAENARWAHRTVELPRNPFTTPPIPVLLTPERFLREIPVATSEGFWGYAWSAHEAEMVRTDFNYDVATRVGKHVRAKLARQHPDIVREYLQALELGDLSPYDVINDPRHVVHRRDFKRIIDSLSTVEARPTGLEELNVCVQEVIGDYRYAMEDSNGWSLFHWKNHIADEKRFQAFFQHIARLLLKPTDVMMPPSATRAAGRSTSSSDLRAPLRSYLR